MATQGQYVGESVIGTIGENVGLGQVLYCTGSPTPTPTDPFGSKGVWYVASANGDFISPADGGVGWISGANQLGIALQAATASPMSITQSGTQITILLKGYYSPGLVGFGGYCYGTLNNGSPIYLMPSSIPGDGPGGTNTSGCVDGMRPTEFGATQGVYRVVGYAYDIVYPYIIRFEPDKTWIEI